MIPKNKPHLNSSNFETDDKNIEQSDTDVDNKPAPINKTTNNTNGIE